LFQKQQAASKLLASFIQVLYNREVGF